MSKDQTGTNAATRPARRTLSAPKPEEQEKPCFIRIVTPSDSVNGRDSRFPNGGLLFEEGVALTLDPQQAAYARMMGYTVTELSDEESQEIADSIAHQLRAVQVRRPNEKAVEGPLLFDKTRVSAAKLREVCSANRLSTLGTREDLWTRLAVRGVVAHVPEGVAASV